MPRPRQTIRLGPVGTGEVSLEELAKQADLVAGDPRMTQVVGGLALARSLMRLIGLVLVLISLFTWLTFPGSDALAVDRSEWFSEVKDLIQLLVVSLLVPILATLLGYIFGRNDRAQD